MVRATSNRAFVPGDYPPIMPIFSHIGNALWIVTIAVYDTPRNFHYADARRARH